MNKVFYFHNIGAIFSELENFSEPKIEMTIEVTNDFLHKDEIDFIYKINLSNLYGENNSQTFQYYGSNKGIKIIDLQFRQDIEKLLIEKNDPTAKYYRKLGSTNKIRILNKEDYIISINNTEKLIQIAFSNIDKCLDDYYTTLRNLKLLSQ